MSCVLVPARRRCRWPVFVGLAAVSLLLSSCGKERKAAYAVEGQVLDGNDQPAVGALVVFHPLESQDDDLTRPVGRVDEKGTFSLTTYEQGDGAPEGKYVVTIEWRPKKTSPFKQAGTDQLRGKYSNPKSSPFHVEITKGTNRLKPFKLE
jgi:hypothetical protein